MSCGRKGRISEKWGSRNEKGIPNCDLSMSKMPTVHKQGKKLWEKVYFMRSDKWIAILERNDKLFLERLERIRSLKKMWRKQHWCSFIL